MTKSRRLFLQNALILGGCFMIGACAPLTLGRRFTINPSKEIKVGYDTLSDVERKMGPAYRKSRDSSGCLILTYLWADGKGSGQKCIILFNKNEIVALVEVVS